MKYKRSKPPFLRSMWIRASRWVHDLRHARRNARAAYSARYILEDMDSARGVELLADATGLPEGVISAALHNILESTQD